VTGLLLRAVPVALAGVVVAAGTAFAHVGISPERVAPGSFGTYTVQVPNEEADEDTVGLDLALPEGFLLESAESVPGWRTTVDTRRDGTPVAVHWQGGRLRPHTFGQFAITGRAPKRPGTLRFPAVQHYETTTESWNGARGSEHPAPTLVVSRSAVPIGTEQVPLATPADGGRSDAAAGTDDLARARADLALALALGAVAALVGLTALTLLRRRASPAAPSDPDGAPARANGSPGNARPPRSGPGG
jgi:uncharacterized protein YcnI